MYEMRPVMVFFLQNELEMTPSFPAMDKIFPLLLFQVVLMRTAMALFCSGSLHLSELLVCFISSMIAPPIRILSPIFGILCSIAWFFCFCPTICFSWNSLYDPLHRMQTQSAAAWKRDQTSQDFLSRKEKGRNNNLKSFLNMYLSLADPSLMSERHSLLSSSFAHPPAVACNLWEMKSFANRFAEFQATFFATTVVENGGLQGPQGIVAAQ